jgi:hypothetical protein
MDNDPRRVEALRFLETWKALRLRASDWRSAGFARLARDAGPGGEPAGAGTIVWWREVVTKYPEIAGGPAVFVEAATVCDDVPDQKRELEEAARLTVEEPLKRRIADDLRRSDLIKPPP